jgi:hypothetical protein
LAIVKKFFVFSWKKPELAEITGSYAILEFGHDASPTADIVTRVT